MQLLANWIMLILIDIADINLSENDLGDLDLQKLAPALAFNKAIFSVDL